MSRVQRHQRLRAIAFPWLMFTALMLAHGVVSAETPRYHVALTVTHLGEVVASPAIFVNENETVGLRGTNPAGRDYRMSVLVRPHSEEEVSVSLSYSAGKVSGQPNVLVPLGEDFSVTEGKLLIGLRIDPAEPEAASED